LALFGELALEISETGTGIGCVLGASILGD
jgi:hypothetical protein